MTLISEVSYRMDVRATDRSGVADVARSSGFFHDEEIEVAEFLVAERLEKGDASGYFFRFAERDGDLVGFTCHGPISGCLHRYDLYWIAVHQSVRGQGLGRELLARSEEDIRQVAGRRIYVDTSSRPDYAPTRRFYEANGYHVAATLADFYRAGDGKTIYLKILADDPAED